MIRILKKRINRHNDNSRLGDGNLPRSLNYLKTPKTGEPLSLMGTVTPLAFTKEREIKGSLYRYRKRL
jgi:hypothetical protein